MNGPCAVTEWASDEIWCSLDGTTQSLRPTTSVGQQGGSLLRSRSRQRFTLFDAMAMVAAFGVGLGLVRGLSPKQFLTLRPRRADEPALGAALDVGGLGVLGPKYRPDSLLLPDATPRDAQRDGLVDPPPASPASSLATDATAGTCRYGGDLDHGRGMGSVSGDSRLPWPSDLCRARYFYLALSANTATAVASSWVTLLIGGRWRADPGWSDRLGRFLGALWIAAFFLWVVEGLVRLRAM